MTKSTLFTKTYKVVVLDPDNNTYTFANRKPNKYNKYTYPLSLLFHDIFPYDKGISCPKQVTFLEGAELLVKQLRLENRLLRADLKTFSKNGGDTDTKHYRSRFKYRMDLAQNSTDTSISKFMSKNDSAIAHWSNVIKTIKTTPEYLVYVLTK
jgi:hypothetical protein